MTRNSQISNSISTLNHQNRILDGLSIVGQEILGGTNVAKVGYY